MIMLQSADEVRLVAAWGRFPVGARLRLKLACTVCSIAHEEPRLSVKTANAMLPRTRDIGIATL
jgi:hypothetical protein